VTTIPEHYDVGTVQFYGDATASYERHLLYDYVVHPKQAPVRERFEAVAHTVRDLLAQRWLKTQETYERANPKFVYYLSMEFLIGRSLTNNIVNLGVEPLARAALAEQGMDLQALSEIEPDAGLGNGGLGRLAACFIDSLATMQIPAIGYGLRYEYGMFRQDISDGAQKEQPDHWLRRPDPWEVARPDERARIRVNASVHVEGGAERLAPGQPATLLGIPHDRPVVGYGGRTINTLRLWSGAAPESFDFGEFSSGDFVGAVHNQVVAQNLTRVLYPDDSTDRGRLLRFAQEYFLVACSLSDILARFRRLGNQWPALPEKVAIQLNDTHPSIAVAELMRLLLDRAGLGWDQAWDLTTRTLAYTNHTLLPEALERWPVAIFEILLPRQLEIIYEINRRFLDDVRRRFPGDVGRVQRVSLIGEGKVKQVRMAHLAIVGTHSTNGVAEIHSELLRTRVLPDFGALFPERFSNKTNGVTPRRWLLVANPEQAALIRDAIGDAWITDLEQLQRLRPLADDAAFRDRFRAAKRAAKTRFAGWLRETSGHTVDPDAIFDCQIKRIHEYKRQLLNLLHVVVLYNRLRDDPRLDAPPRVAFFAGKAAPAYRLAKLIIKLINDVAAAIDADPAVRGRLKVLFLPNYGVTLAERLIPASDVSEQISTAGYEASGTSNMKFMMNGALTVGTRDGATIEMARAAGEEHFFLFGLSADEVAASRGWYSPWWHYEHEPETRRAVDLLLSAHFNPDAATLYAPVREVLLTRGDYYMHLADLTAYADTQTRVGALFADAHAWTRSAVVNVASSGRFSSDRTIREYAEQIWGAVPVPVE
jgi:starch phosphorylase